MSKLKLSGLQTTYVTKLLIQFPNNVHSRNIETISEFFEVSISKAKKSLSFIAFLYVRAQCTYMYSRHTSNRDHSLFLFLCVLNGISSAILVVACSFSQLLCILGNRVMHQRLLLIGYDALYAVFASLRIMVPLEQANGRQGRREGRKKEGNMDR